MCVHGAGFNLIQQQYKQMGVIAVKQQCHNRLEGVGGANIDTVKYHDILSGNVVSLLKHKVSKL